MTPEARETIMDCLTKREELLQERISVWQERGGRIKRHLKNEMIADALDEIEFIQAARRELIIDQLPQAVAEEIGI